LAKRGARVLFGGGLISVHFKSALSVLISGFGSFKVVSIKPVAELQKDSLNFFRLTGEKQLGR